MTDPTEEELFERVFPESLRRDILRNKREKGIGAMLKRISPDDDERSKEYDRRKNTTKRRVAVWMLIGFTLLVFFILLVLNKND